MSPFKKIIFTSLLFLDVLATCDTVTPLRDSELNHTASQNILKLHSSPLYDNENCDKNFTVIPELQVSQRRYFH